MFFWALVFSLSLSSMVAFSDFDPCNPVPGYPCSDRCLTTPPDGWGVQVSVHARGLQCFKFYRQRCSETGWTLIYEGPDSSICDCVYNPDIKQRYKVERYQGINGGSCTTFNDSCKTIWWSGVGASNNSTSCP